MICVLSLKLFAARYQDQIMTERFPGGEPLFQILQGLAEDNWRSETDLVIAPDVRGIDWDAFGHGPRLIETGETAAAAAVPRIQQWFSHALCA